ncbi:MAG: FYDLN acid domain-containing protein [Rhodospirillales bacterium]
MRGLWGAVYDLLRAPAVCPKCGTEQPKAAPRVFGVGRSATRRWQGRLPTFQAETEVPEKLAAEDEAEGLDDADTAEAGDAEDEDALVAEPDEADEAAPHLD